MEFLFTTILNNNVAHQNIIGLDFYACPSGGWYELCAYHNSSEKTIGIKVILPNGIDCHSSRRKVYGIPKRYDGKLKFGICKIKNFCISN